MLLKENEITELILPGLINNNLEKRA